MTIDKLTYKTMAEVKKPDFVLEVEQLVHRMLCKFNEHCKFAADSNFVETLNAIRQGKREYEEFFKKNDHILHQRIVQFLKSLKAVFNLLEMRYLIRANIKSCATVDLQQMRAWLYTAFQSREVVSLFRSVTEKLSVDFAINNFFRIAKIFATVTAACWQLKEDEAFLRSVGVVYHIDGDDFQSSCLNAEIQYMDAMFRQSIARMQDKDSESIEHMEKDKALDGFLQELKLPDVYKSFPHILRNFQDALSLARVMLPKLQEFELIMAVIPEMFD